MLSGLFFVLIALFQLVWSRLVLRRPTTTVLAAGIVVNVGAAALWAVSRTAGAPFGPHAGEPELVQAAGLCALLLEIYVVMGAGWVWYRGQQAGPVPGFANAMVLAGLGSVIVSTSALGAVSGLQHGHHAPDGAQHHDHGTVSGHTGGHRDSVAPLDVNVVPPPTAPAPAPAPAEPAAPDAHGDHHH
jgi:hypothetical protein